MAELIVTRKPSGNSNQRRKEWRKFHDKYTSLGYEVKRKKDFVASGKVISTMFIAKIK